MPKQPEPLSPFESTDRGKDLMTLGVISDTHGLLRPEAIAALGQVDHILHAGDIGNSEILDVLRQIAPVTAIRGNIDTHGPCSQLAAKELFALAGHHFYLVHSLADLDISPAAAGVSAVISGHSHKPVQEVRNGVLYLNPGSAGPRRFNLPVTIALISATPAELKAKIVPLL